MRIVGRPNKRNRQKAEGRLDQGYRMTTGRHLSEGKVTKRIGSQDKCIHSSLNSTSLFSETKKTTRFQ